MAQTDYVNKSILPAEWLVCIDWTGIRLPPPPHFEVDMSKSYKKYGILKIGYPWAKTIANRKLRRRNKIRVQHGKYPLMPKEVVNQYDIIDWKFIWERVTDKTAELKRRYFNK